MVRSLDCQLIFSANYPQPSKGNCPPNLCTARDDTNSEKVLGRRGAKSSTCFGLTHPLKSSPILRIQQCQTVLSPGQLNIFRATLVQQHIGFSLFLTTLGMRVAATPRQCRLMGTPPGSPTKGRMSNDGKLSLLWSRNWERPMVIPSWPLSG